VLYLLDYRRQDGRLAQRGGVLHWAEGAGIPVELHIFELGPHGTHMGEGLAPALHELTVTPTLIGDWMQLHGWMAADAQ